MLYLVFYIINIYQCYY